MAYLIMRYALDHGLPARGMRAASGPSALVGEPAVDPLQGVFLAVEGPIELGLIDQVQEGLEQGPGGQAVAGQVVAGQQGRGAERAGGLVAEVVLAVVDL